MRVTRRLFNVGRIGGDTYYCTNDTPEAHTFIALRQLEGRLADVRAEEQLTALDAVAITEVTKGRAMLLLKELNIFDRELDGITGSAGISGATQREAGALRSRISQLRESASHWLSSCVADDSCTPAEVSTEMIGLTAEELHDIVKPLYPRAQMMTDAVRVIIPLSIHIRRFPNPLYESRFAKDTRVATEFLHDRTDALLHIAKQWGGPECALQATLAANELGLLRDHRFIFPGLEAKSFEIRLAAIACLAFLWSDDGNEQLRLAAMNDPDAGVRQSALWAYGFASGEDAQELVRERRCNDANVHVRTFAEKAMQLDERGWWGL